MKTLTFGIAALLSLPLLAFQDEPQDRGEDTRVVDETLKAGLCAKYYSIGKEIKKFPDLVLDQKAQLCRIDPQINFEAKDGWGFGGLQWKEYFAAVWSGVLRAPVTGKYTLYLKSDDGSRLFIDGKMLIDNDGKHRLDEDGKTVDLTAGDHEFRVEYFQNKDKAGCQVSWKYEGVDKQVIPTTAFWHKFDKELDREAK